MLEHIFNCLYRPSCYQRVEEAGCPQTIMISNMTMWVLYGKLFRIYLSTTIQSTTDSVVPHSIIMDAASFSLCFCFFDRGDIQGNWGQSIVARLRCCRSLPKIIQLFRQIWKHCNCFSYSSYAPIDKVIIVGTDKHAVFVLPLAERQNDLCSSSSRLIPTPLHPSHLTQIRGTS